MKYARLLLPLAALLLGGCSKNIQTNEAVRAGVIKHLSNNKGLQVGSMDIDITSVTFRDKEADAVVSFKPKGGDPATGMQMNYTLEQKGGEWVVKPRAEKGGAHPGAAMPPSGMGGQVQMPPAHPPVDAGKAPAPAK